MKLFTRSNLLGLLTGILAVALGRWGKYKDWWWYDNLNHLVAGVSLAALFDSEDASRRHVLGIVLSINLMWELFEYYKNVYPWDGSVEKKAAAEDTLLDGLLVYIGAAAVLKDGD